MTTPHWILAFNASCRSCTALSRVIEHECSQRLQVRPLADAAVEDLRAQAFSGEAPWAPTLIRVSGADIRAWTGRTLPFRLARLLGPVASLRVLGALGQIRRGTDPTTEAADGPSRRRFLRWSAGAGVVGTLMLTGTLPSFADADDRWAADHRDSLPDNYDDLVLLPVARRRAVFRASTPAVRSGFWVEHLSRRLDDPTLDDRQRAALESARELVGDVTLFGDGGLSGQQNGHIRAVVAQVQAAFGRAETGRIVGLLGPDDEPDDDDELEAACGCATASDWCSSPTRCRRGGCTQQSGCGAFWSYTCDGQCS